MLLTCHEARPVETRDWGGVQRSGVTVPGNEWVVTSLTRIPHGHRAAQGREMVGLLHGRLGFSISITKS